MHGTGKANSARNAHRGFCALAAILTALTIAGCSPGGSTTGDPQAASTDRTNSAVNSTSDAPRGAASDPAPFGEASAEVPAPEVKPGEMLVKFKAGTPTVRIASALPRSTAMTVRAFSIVPGLRHVKLAPGVTLDAALETYRSRPDVEYAEPNYVVRASALPNDPRFADQWGLNNIGQSGGTINADVDAPQAWDVTQGDGSLVVAVIDSGVDYTHPDLAANIYRNTSECVPNGIDDDGNGYVDDCNGIDAVNDDSDPDDDYGHGTHVAGIIGAVGNNGMGISGVAWNVKILPCKFIGVDGEGDTADAIECLEYVAAFAASGVNVVATNNSWGGGPFSQALVDAIAAQRQRGILFVTSAGNGLADHDHQHSYPCDIDAPNLVCVASITRTDDLSWFSDFGRRSVHVGAPGSEILSTLLGGTYGEHDGTSMASPHVAGIAALLKAQDGTRDWRAIRNLILAGGKTSAALQSKTITGREVSAAGSLTCSNSIVLERLRPLLDLPVQRVGTPVLLQMLHINCASPNGAPTVSISPGGTNVVLHDDGLTGDTAANDGIYSATWTSNVGGTYTLSFPGGSTSEATFDPQLRAGFPLKALSPARTTVGNDPNIHTLVGNIDADPEPEILRSGVGFGVLYAWNQDGTRATGWPEPQVLAPNGIFDVGIAYPVLGRFTGSSHLDVFVNYTARSQLAYAGNGVMLPGWPQPTNSEHPATTADLDGDGIDEIIQEDRNNPGATPGNTLIRVRRADGTLFPGWPVGLLASGSTGALRTPAVADLDGDGKLEIIAADFQRVHAYHHDGRGVAGFPVNVDARSFPVVGDVDGDGAPEIVVAAQAHSPAVAAVIHILSNKGAIERTITTSFEVTNDVAPALADMDGDGFPEIVVEFGRIFSPGGVGIWRGDGTLLTGWPVPLTENHNNSGPVVGDIDGDGEPDILFTTLASASAWDGFARAYNHLGQPLTGFPKRLPSMYGAVPAIADLDLDGRNEAIVSGIQWLATPGGYDAVWAFDLGGPAGNARVEWGQFMNDAKHSGFYETGKNLATTAYLATQIRGTGTVTSSPAGIACGTDCIEPYPKGTTVTLTASGGTFAGWRGACAGQSNPCVVSINDYTTVLAQFGAFTLTVNSSGPGSVTSTPAGIACPGTCSLGFPTGSVVQLTATAQAGAYFKEWSGACSGQSQNCSVTMDAAQSVSAVFAAKPVLTVTAGGTGTGVVTSNLPGINCGSDCSEPYDLNSFITLTATAAPGSLFTEWGTHCFGSAPTCTVEMFESRQVTATFTKEVREIVVNRVGTGTGSVTSQPAGINCGSDCSESYLQNTLVVLTASPEAGSVFTGWIGACNTGAPTCTLNVTGQASATVVTANFTLTSAFPLTVTRSGTGEGAVKSVPAGIDCGIDCSEVYARDALVTLTATPAAGSVFSGWSGGCAGPDVTCTVLMAAAQSVNASFTPKLPLTVALVGNGSGIVTSGDGGINCGADCIESYASSSVVTLTAAASPGSVFNGWGGACSGNATTCTVPMSIAKSVTAGFSQATVLSVALSGNGSGTVTSGDGGLACGTDCTESYAPSAVVTLNAVAAQGSAFDGWSGACSGQGASCSVPMTASQSVGASFRVIVSSPPPSGGNGGGGGGRLDWTVLAFSAIVLLLRLWAKNNDARTPARRFRLSFPLAHRAGFGAKLRAR